MDSRLKQFDLDIVNDLYPFSRVYNRARGAALLSNQSLCENEAKNQDSYIISIFVSIAFEFSINLRGVQQRELLHPH